MKEKGEQNYSQGLLSAKPASSGGNGQDRRALEH